MKKILILLIVSSVLVSCRRKDKNFVSFVSPEAGMGVSSGKALLLKTDAEPGTFDSIGYYIDTTFVGSRKDTSTFNVSTKGFPLGARLLTAKIYKEAAVNEAASNIQLLAAKAPIQYKYTVVNTFPHDTSSYTEGLEYHDGFLYESDGGYEDSPEGASSLRKTDLKTGKVLKRVDIHGHYFAEGITVIGNKILQLTYQEGVAYEYDKNTFKKLREFPFSIGTGQGWGLYFDGKHIYNTDGSNTIHILDPETYRRAGSIEVLNHTGPVNQLNELELIDGKLFANVYQSDKIVIIDPKTGSVEGEIDLTNLYPKRNEHADVLNGIAWDSKGRRLFVTGKKWNKLFEIKIL
ncbi:MAG TPA: glutaminyl-peptide cyclotransferase [Pedobacter sp.]|jgi:glutamine cyclotransferase